MAEQINAVLAAQMKKILSKYTKANFHPNRLDLNIIYGKRRKEQAAAVNKLMQELRERQERQRKLLEFKRKIREEDVSFSVADLKRMETSYKNVYYEKVIEDD